jgi:hypothetical protein
MPAIQLTKDQLARLSLAEQQATEVLARLGAAHLNHAAVAAQFEKSKSLLARREREAMVAVERQDAVAGELVRELNLPPGKWTFNAEQGQLVQSEEREP